MPINYIFQDLGALLHYSWDPSIKAGAVIGGVDAAGGDYATRAAVWLQPGSTPIAPLWLPLNVPFPDGSSWAFNATQTCR